MKLLAALLMSVAFAAHAEVKVTVGEVFDQRRSGRFPGTLEVKLKLQGTELGNCKGARLVVKDATDDTGKSLIQQKVIRSTGKFEPLKKPFGNFDRTRPAEDEYEVEVDLANPAREAKSIQLNGVLELLMAGGDPESVITADLTKDAGKPLANDALKAAGVELTLSPVKGSQVGYKVTDPNKKVAAVEFCGADGKPLETQGWNSSGFNDTKQVNLTLENNPPANAAVKIYLVTEKSVVGVPIALKQVALP